MTTWLSSRDEVPTGWYQAHTHRWPTRILVALWKW